MLWDNLNSDPMPALDTETRADGSLLGISLAWAEDGEVVGTWITNVNDWKDYFNLFSGVKFCGHNASFDYGVLKEVGIEVQFGFDSYIASLWAWPPYSRDHSLKSLSVQELGVQPWGSAKDLIEEYGSMDKVPVDILSEYAIQDAINTYRLCHEILQPKITGMKASMAMSIECALIPVNWELNHNGVKLDLGQIDTIKEGLQKDLAFLNHEINTQAGVEVYLNSPVALSKVLFGKMGIDPGATPKTKSGFYSTAAQHLEQIQTNHPIIEKIILWRQLNKLLTTYISDLKGCLRTDGRVYSKFNPLGSVTGRYSSSGPNLHNLPIQSKRGREIRKIVVAEEGYKLVDVDYNQFQLRILADMSGSARMRQIFKDDGDIHSETGKAVFRTNILTKNERDRAKAINFGLIFGMGPAGLIGYGFTFQEAGEFYRRYFENYDGVREFINHQHKLAWRGWVSTRYGRPCWLPRLHKDDSRAFISSVERLSVNYPIQGTEGDMIKIAMIRMHKLIREKGYHARIILQIHDELVFEVPKDEVDNFVIDVRERMESIPFSIPLSVDISVGDNWLECKDG